MVLIGGFVFLSIAWRECPLLSDPRLVRLERAMPWLAMTLLLGLVGFLAATTANATDVTGNMWCPAAWIEFDQKTRIGHIWSIRSICALGVLVASLYARFSPRARWRYILCAVVAAVTLRVSSFASHSAAEAQSVATILPHALDLLLASLWLGALPGVIAALAVCSENRNAELADRPGLQTLKRFSTIALPVMLGILVSGLTVADQMVDTSYAALVASMYGWLLTANSSCLRLFW